MDSITAAMAETSPSTRVLFGPWALIDIPTWHAGMLGKCLSIQSGVTFFMAAWPNSEASNSPSSVMLDLIASSISNGDP